LSGPNLNTEVYIDDRRFTFFHIVQIRWKLDSLTTFQINYGDPNRNHRWIKNNSIIKVYLSWGNKTPVKYFEGMVTRTSRNLSDQRFMVTASGVNSGLYMRDKQAWDSTYERLVYNNRKCSEIMSDLLAQVDQIDAHIFPYSGEPSLSIEAEKDSNILSTFKKIASYGGYEWIIDKDSKIIVRKQETPSASNARSNLLLGNYNDFTGLPELPHAYIKGATVPIDTDAIKNFYKVNGKDGIYGTGFNQFSINKYRRGEGEYTDESLTSVQSCEVVARRLSEINGEPKVSIPINIKGNTEINVGDVVYCDDLDRQLFTSLDNQYLKVFSKNDTISQSGWNSDMQIGSPKKEITDVLT